MLLKYKVDLNVRIQEQPLLSFAIQRGGKETPEIVAMLANAGADVNARGNQGQTPIFAAENMPEAIKPLLAAGANLEARDRYGNTPLVRYAFMEPMVKELLADGADPMAVGRNGDNALKVAKQYQCAACSKLIEDALKQRATGAANIP
jgi:ankyrin repeat protein